MGSRVDDILHILVDCISSIYGGVRDFSAPHFLVKRFQLHALYLRKKGGAIRAPKEMVYKLQFYMELLHGKVYGAESQIPLYTGTDDMFYCSISLLFKPLVLSIDCLHQ
jgi:hypothetical protein